MPNWKDALRADPTDWLLEEAHPGVRFYALRDLLDRAVEDADVAAARRGIMEAGVVPEMLKRQEAAEYRRNASGFYTRKYGGFVWSLIALAEYGAAPTAQIRAQCEFLIENAQERADGGFSQHTAAKTGGGRISEVIPCLTGNMVFCLIRFGYLDDPRLWNALDWLVRFMRYNDGTETDPQVPPYDRYEMCWGAHTCHMGAVKALKAFAEVPKGKRTPEIDGAIGRAAEFLLIHRVFKRSHDLRKVSKPGWLKFGFPLMYQTDALEIFDILTGLGMRDARMDDAVRLVMEKQTEDGRWRMENTYASDRLLVPLADTEERDKWITLRAMRALKRYGEL